MPPSFTTMAREPLARSGRTQASSVTVLAGRREAESGMIAASEGRSMRRARPKRPACVRGAVVVPLFALSEASATRAPAPSSKP